MKQAIERRRSPRYRVAEAEALVSWWDGTEFRTELVRAEDISTGGVRLAVSGPAIPSQSLWLCFAAAPTPDWLPARVVGTSGDENTQGCIRAEFPDGCPYEVLKTLAFGGSAAGGQAPDRARSFRLAPESLSFRIAREDASPGPHKSFRLTTGSLGDRRPASPGARPSPLPVSPPAPTNGRAPIASSRPTGSSEPLPPPEPPPLAAVADVARRGPLDPASPYRATRRDQDRVNLLAAGVRAAATASILAVLGLVLTQEYGTIRPLIVILEVINDR